MFSSRGNTFLFMGKARPYSKQNILYIHDTRDTLLTRCQDVRMSGTRRYRSCYVVGSAVDIKGVFFFFYVKHISFSHLRFINFKARLFLLFHGVSAFIVFYFLLFVLILYVRACVCVCVCVLRGVHERLGLWLKGKMSR